MKRLVLFLTAALALHIAVYSQVLDIRQADSLFRVNKEIYFRFQLTDREFLNEISEMISVDKVSGDTVYAYANKAEYEKFSRYGYGISLLMPPGSMFSDDELMKPNGDNNYSGPSQWNFYPTYQQYVDTMQYFAAAYPSICKLDTIGLTNMGRLLLAVKISKDVNEEGAKPQFLYTSSIHGDETAGYVGMLHLIEYILTNYSGSSRIRNLVDSVEIYINPLGNPDGTYHGGNNSVNGATRGNANGIDMNRNYPDPAAGPHPDGNPWQTETIAFMNYADSLDFSMSANFHGGSEVVNYPWDTWSRLTADDSWWKFVSREYADTVHAYGPAGYFTFQQNGITNGYAWYRITGGRQDYMNYYHYCREVTIELSNTKLLPASQLLNWWNYNYHSYLNYIEQVKYGIQGIVTDTATGLPLMAKVTITGHDIDNSFVYSRASNGFYTRLLDQGNWDLTFSRMGYYSKTIQNVPVSRFAQTRLDVQLKPLWYGTSERNQSELTVYPVPASSLLHFIFPENDTRYWKIQVFNAMGQMVRTFSLGSEGDLVGTLDVSGFSEGLYTVVMSGDHGIFRRPILVKR
jgi:hypothetical protein